METTSFNRAAVLVLAVCLGSWLLLVPTAAAHPGHLHPGRKVLQEAADSESYMKPATASAVPPEIAAAAAALAATAVPIPEASATAADVSAMVAAASASLETPPAGGYKRCASTGGNTSQRNAAERRFKKLLALLQANGTIIGLNGTANSEVTTEAGGISTQQASTVTIPVYFHVITFNGQGVVTSNMLSAQLTVLNNAYRAHGFQFSWAGAWQYTSTSTALYTAGPGSSPERAIKQQIRHGTQSSLNIWMWDIAGDVLGFARFPWDSDSTLDGVVLKTGTLPGGNVGSFNQGDTATHEVGHWLGLYHTFQGSCSSNNDFVSDTPAVASASTGCPWGRDSCSGGGADMVNNFMDYTDDSCMNSFTLGQGSRMGAAWAAYRNGK